jgi:hypothetical protein
MARSEIAGAIVAFVVIFGALVLPTACASPPPVVSKAVCPPIIAYSAAEERQAAQELATLPAGSEIGKMLGQYHDERDMLRACQAS